MASSSDIPVLRSPEQVVRRAMICVALDVRWSVEDSPLTPETRDRLERLQQRAIDWLNAVGAADEMLPIDHHILGAPIGNIEVDLRPEIIWGREYAAVLGWALLLTDDLPAHHRVHADVVHTAFRLFDTDAGALCQGSRLRPLESIHRLHQRHVLIPDEDRRRSLSPAIKTPVTEKLFDGQRDQQLRAAGIALDPLELQHARDFHTGLDEKAISDCRALYLARRFTTDWLVGVRSDFYSTSEN